MSAAIQSCESQDRALIPFTLCLSDYFVLPCEPSDIMTLHSNLSLSRHATSTFRTTLSLNTLPRRYGMRLSLDMTALNRKADYSLDLDDHALTLDAVKHTSVIDGHILLRDDFDNFLRHDTTSQCSNVMQLRAARSSTTCSLATITIGTIACQLTAHLRTLQSGP